MQDKPGYLRKTIGCFVLVILIQLLKKYLDGIFPGTLLFHHFLLTLLQVAVLLWTIIILLIPSASFIKKFLLLIGILALPELLFTYWLHHPLQIPSSLHPVFMRYSTQADNRTIQFIPECSEYNSSLFYTLKPSSRFVFSSLEFSDSFYTNKLGLRDDDASLQEPAIICIGDSYAMGWGVKQNETFAEQINSITHKKVLNAAISSYGTVRELKNLYRLDTSGLQYIIIQYCHNDYAENKEFVENNYSLPVSSEKKYDSLVQEDHWSKRWFPGKRFVTITKFYAEKKMNPFFYREKRSSTDSAAFHMQQSARYFTDILLHSAINFKKIKVFVVDLNPRETMNNDLADEVNRLMKIPAYREHFNDHLIMVPVADLLTEEDYYILDSHIRVSGHRKIAERLSNYMSSGN